MAGETQIADTTDIEVSWPEARLRTLRRWRGASGFGGLCLFSAFFMPAISVCGSPEVPAENFVEGVDSWPLSLEDLAWAICVCLAPYLFGLLTFLVTLRGRSYRRRTQSSLGISVSILFGIVASILAVAMILMWISYGGGWDTGAVLWTVAVFASLAYWLRSLKLKAGGLLCMRWYGALCCNLWLHLLFWTHLWDGDTHFGLWLSILGCSIIFVATTAETQIRCGTDLWSAIWQLLRCRVELFDLHGPRCFSCGYLLLGLSTQRCPECGTAFDPAAHGLEPAAGT